MDAENHSTKRCSVDECNRPHKGKGFCELHLKRMRKHGVTEIPAKACWVEECEQPHYGNGLCRLHHLRQWRGTPLGAPIRGQGDRTCIVTSCEQPKRKGGMCASHYDTQRRSTPEFRARASARSRERYGNDPEYQKRKRVQAQRRLHGYRKLLPAILARQGIICPLCGEWMAGDLMVGKLFHVDHIVPVSKGGVDTLENLQLTHMVCNIRKGNRT